LKGWLRRLGRNLRTVKGAVLALVTAAVLGLWLFSVLVQARQEEGFDAAMVRRFGPWWLLAYALLTLLLSSGERAIAFTPAEVTFLFPAPFRRRQLVLYKIAVGVGNALLGAFFLTLFLGRHAPHLTAAYVALVLILVFLQLVSTCAALALGMLGERFANRPLGLLLGTVGVLALAAWFSLGGDPTVSGGLERLERSPAAQVVLAPLRWFLEAFTAERLWPDLGFWAARALAVDLVLLALVFTLDAHYLETAASASERWYARLQRFRGGGALATGRRGAGPVRWGVPAVPWWGGAGPVLWRQLTTVLRSLDRLTPLLLVFLLLLTPLFGKETRMEASQAPQVLGGILVAMSLFVTPLVPFDFRGDLDRMDELKALPLRPVRLAAGQLAVPVLLVTGLQWLALLVMCVALGQFEESLGAVAVFAVPFNFLLFEIENLLFLWFPMRLFAPPGDLQAIGRNLLRWLAQFVCMALAVALAIVAGEVVYFLTWNGPAGYAAAWLTLAGFALALLPLVALAFRQFDVARDTPP
jgi:hypothetical protein